MFRPEGMDGFLTNKQELRVNFVGLCVVAIAIATLYGVVKLVAWIF